jgi:hypothetical protein
MLSGRAPGAYLSLTSIGVQDFMTQIQNDTIWRLMISANALFELSS